MPRRLKSAYHLYFRFCKNVLKQPPLHKQLIASNMTNRENYKSFVWTVLNASIDDLPPVREQKLQKFMGNDNFSGMSKNISRMWNEADALTRSVFMELSKENRDLYKNELFDSYKTFNKNHPPPPRVLSTYAVKASTQRHKMGKAKGASTQSKNLREVHCREVPPKVQETSKAMAQPKERNAPVHPKVRITEVDMSDEEILSIALSIWGINPTSLSTTQDAQGNKNFVSDEALSEFMSDLDWKL